MTAAPAPGAPPADGSAFSSAICHLDADRGRLTYRGYDVCELAERGTFEETGFLLVRGHLPSRDELAAFRADLRAAAPLDRATRAFLAKFAPGADEMAVLRTVVSALAESPAGDPAIRLIAQLPVLVAARGRLRAGARPVAPRRGLAWGANLLYMLRGARAEVEIATAFESALILRADNELNPSAFAARVTAATGADLYGCVTAALAALAGPQHGGHSLAVAKMLEQVGSIAHVDAFVREQAARGAKFAGFGHPVYRGEDPRTGTARALADRAAAAAGKQELFELARALEERVVAATGSHANVDYYLSVLYQVADIPRELFSPVFAVARIVGWIAHVQEQVERPGLIRPRAQYVGPLDQRYRAVRSR